MQFEIMKGGKQQQEQILMQKRQKKIEGYRRSYLKHKMLNHTAMAVYYGILYYSKTANHESEVLKIYKEIAEMKYICNLMLHLSVRELIAMFPISKEYDGWKYESKDYWSTMEYLNSIDIDAVISNDDALQNFFWNYYNPHIIGFSVKEMLYTDRLIKSIGGKGMLESMIEAMGMEDKIHTYTYDRDNGVMIDNKTGEIHKVTECRPKHEFEKYIKVIHPEHKQ